MLTGEPPFRHGILANAGGPLDITQSYWSATKIKVPTLTQCAMAAGLTTAGVNWPVTVQANLTWNLPEVYAKRNGDSFDLRPSPACHSDPRWRDRRNRRCVWRKPPEDSR